MATMTASDNLISLIKADEGFVDHIYMDCGKPAIGYGHNLQAGESFPNRITEDQATALLRKDLGYAEHAASTLFTSTIVTKQPQFDALVDLIYNVGAVKIKTSNLLSFLNSGQYTAAAVEFLSWDHMAGKLSRGLLKRRLTEIGWFLSNLPADKPQPVPTPALATTSK